MVISRITPRRILAKIFPIVTWAKDYNVSVGVEDLVAGVTVALTLIPQSIAYASLAGFEPQYGLYSSFAGSLVYIFLGTVPEINIGPTALLSLLTFNFTHHTNPDFATLLCFLGGFVQLVVGISRLGFLVNFVSMPVVSGFTSATALVIACSQIKGLVGLSFKAETFLSTWMGLFENIKKVRTGDTVLSVICIITLLAMRQLKEIKISPKKNEPVTKKHEMAQKTIWFISVGRNAAIVIGCAIAAYIMDLHNSTALILTGKVQSGLPRFGLPNFNTTVGNETFTFTMMAQHLGSGILVVPLIGIISNVAIAKAFAKGKVLDASQEIIALGVGNVISGLVQSIPVNGSFSRSAVSNASGVRTPAAGLYTCIIVLMTLGFLTPYFYFIPKAALSSVIICAVLFMIDLTIIRDLWKSSKLDLIPLFGTFLACLFVGIEFGILIGIAIDVVILLYYNSRPRLFMEVKEITPNVQYTQVTPSGGLFFPSATYVRESIGKIGVEKDEDHTRYNNSVIIVDCMNLQRADWTSLQGLKSLLQDFKKESRIIGFTNCRPTINEKFSNEMGEDFLYCSTQDDIKRVLLGKNSNGEYLTEIKLDVIEMGRVDGNLSPSKSTTQM